MLAGTANPQAKAVAPERKAVPEIKTFLHAKDSDDPRVQKEYVDFRDRAAYVYVTGSFPTHLRSFFTNLLRKATKYASAPTALDQRNGNLKVTPEVVRALGLDQHPMVEQTRAYLKHNFKIQASRGVTERRPYSKIFMFRESPMKTGVEKVTIQVDGSVKAGWE